MSDSVLDAAIRAAVDAAGARSGWIVVANADGARVVAVAGDTDARVGTLLAPTTPAASAVRTGQPAARAIAADDRTADGAGGARTTPTALLTVPVGDGGGAIELADKLVGGPFTIDDIEVVSMLADVVAAAFDVADGPDVPSPEQLAAELSRLHVVDRQRYAMVAQVVSALVGGS